MKSSQSHNKAIAFAHRLLKFRPRSKNELKQRLCQKGFSAENIGSVCKELEQKGLIDDKRFSKLWALSRIQTKPASLFNIKQELLIKGVDKDLIEETLNELGKDFNEYETALALAKKRSNILSGLTKDTAKRRLFTFLQRRGFSFDIIYKVIDEISVNNT